MERIRPETIIAKYTPEQICAGAEAYYAAMDPEDSIHLQKPLRTFREAAEGFEDLGAMLRELHLAPGMRVLDFGAGSCWISNYLSQMGCLTTACDPSRTALEMGRRAIAANPWANPENVSYLLFEGRRIEVSDESFDRIICFDVLHHLPNWEAILEEMHRVLKPGGAVGFKEPGRQHSQSGASQYEMRHHVVLENDVRLERLQEIAERIGFRFKGWEPIVKRTFSIREYRSLLGGFGSFWKRFLFKRKLFRYIKRHSFELNRLYLTKGELILDSRLGTGLMARIEPESAALELEAGETGVLRVEVKNIGKATWLGLPSEGTGRVSLGCHLFEQDGRLRQEDFARTPIRGDLAPGERQMLELCTGPLDTGDYRLALDMVSEKIGWFEMAQPDAGDSVSVQLIVRDEG